MTILQISKIAPISYVDGPGKRTVVWFQGCSMGCVGCQNRRLWPTIDGRSAVAEDLAVTLALLAGKNSACTITGGEPFQQPEALATLVINLLEQGVQDILVYTGYTWEELHSPEHPAAPYIADILACIDTLVDGRFERSNDDDYVAWRGSRNQRPINVQATLATGILTVRDWDSPMTLTEDGDLVLPAGWSATFDEIGIVTPTRMCGQAREV